MNSFLSQTFFRKPDFSVFPFQILKKFALRAIRFCHRGGKIVHSQMVLITRNYLTKHFNRLVCNGCVCAVVGFRSRHCPRGQTLNEDSTLNLHVTPPLRKHFVASCATYTISIILLSIDLYTNTFSNLVSICEKSKKSKR